MIVLLGKIIWHGDSIKKLYPRSQCGPKPIEDLISPLAQIIHEYFVFGVKGGAELADIIREYNICNVSYDGDKFIVISGNTHDVILLVTKLSQSVNQGEKLLSEYFTSCFPEIFRNVPRASNGALMLWKPKS